MTQHGFIERSIRGALSFFKEALFADETALAPGLLQTLDPRIKTVTILAFILLVMFTRNLAVLAWVYGLCLLLAVLSKIRLGFFLKRTWIFMPFFSLLIVIPALFSFTSPGEPLFGTGAASISRNGLLAAGFFIGRVITSVSLTILLSLTTPHFELLKALRYFGIPQVFVMVLGISYRYIYLFVEIVENTYRAIKSRVGSRMHYRKGQRIVTWNIAHLWTRSYRLNEQVYGAMLSRGFHDEPITLNLFQTKPRDWLWLLGSAVMILLLVYSEYRT
jgi:cobalt/nickel transport system permease protein